MPTPPRKQKVGNFPGSSLEEIENEPSWGANHTHRVGYKTKGSRFAGISDVEPQDHWETEEEEKAAEEAMEKYRKLRERNNKGDLLNFQDIMDAQTDMHKKHPKDYPPSWKFVVNSTEDFVKYQQDWPVNVKRREKEEEQKKQEEKEKKQKKEQEKAKKESQGGDEKDQHDGDESKGRKDSDSTRGSQTSEDEQEDSSAGESDKSETTDDSHDEDNAEDDWRQNRGGDHSNKHHSAYGPGLQAEHDFDKDYKRLREKYTPQEIALLRALQHEKMYMHSLGQNDGSIESPAKIKDPKHRVLGIDKQDTMTPDNWVSRSPNLIRQTGQHPMNAEPRFTALFSAGLITPNELHYVRSHGAVPRLFWETHILDIDNGMMRLTMDDLVDKFEPINISVMIACDAVRRGEMNLISKSKGFSWGPGAMSNAYWKGARLVEVLKAAGVTRDKYDHSKKHYVHFEGGDSPSEGKYATSIAFDYALDPMNDIILAYEMNNTKLPPDHGFPVRVVMPGYVGARSVKWLSKIWVSDRENDSHYHIWDNRVLPAFITEKDGEFAQTMFRHPDTVCYEQNLNSVIAKPAQGEQLDPREVLKKETYRIEGVAYDGGGHEVQRVEVSLDDGESWLYACRTFPEKPIRHGNKFWSWCFWHVDVDSLHFVCAKSVAVRAWNAFKNTQPPEPTWNIMGMMNNCWYRVKAFDGPDRTLIYRHPVDPEGDGGWMKPSTQNQLAAAKQSSGVPDKQFTRQEVEKHDKKDDCWLVVNNNVYDVTSVVGWHPGGPATIIANAGMLSADVTSSFESIHDDYAHKKLAECAIGRVTDKAAKLIQEQAKADAVEAAKSDPSKSEFLLQSKRWTPVKLINREKVSADTFTYTFEYKEKGSDKKLGLGTCQHIEFGIHMLDKMLVRQYTPTRPILENEDDGTFELVLKTYFPDENQPGGAFSNLLYKLEIGEQVSVSGPSGDIIYKGSGKFSIEGEDRSFSKVNLILGGSGVTPGYQLLHRVLESKGDKTQIRVVDANKSEADILLKDEMDKMEKKHSDQFKVTHVISHPHDPDHWSGEKGHVNADIIKKSCFAPKDDVVSLLCGPPAMIQKAVLPALVDWGFKEDENLFGF